MNAPPVVLTIAGFDPSSGAGVTADIKTIAAHGCYGVSCITALTVQSTVGVRAVLPMPAATVRQTLQELAADMPIAAIHIGMLGSGEVAAAVADFLGDEMKCRPEGSAEDALPPIVLDPICRSSSGADLLDRAGLDVLRSRLLRMATVVTPNLEEASALTESPVKTLEDMRRAAECLHEFGARAVVVKGGHLEGNEALELLSQMESCATSPSDGEPVPQVLARAVRALTWEFGGPKLESRATHGTGCAFASALACNLALGQPLPDSVGAAKKYVAEAIAHAYPLGHGHGPMNHLFRGVR